MFERLTIEWKSNKNTTLINTVKVTSVVILLFYQVLLDSDIGLNYPMWKLIHRFQQSINLIVMGILPSVEWDKPNTSYKHQWVREHCQVNRISKVKSNEFLINSPKFQIAVYFDTAENNCLLNYLHLKLLLYGVLILLWSTLYEYLERHI